jgi:hypothetical protein
MPYSRLIIPIWLAAWMLALPLVHVHPEADHQHGWASHVHGGLTHSVFSADLPCEYHAASPDHVPHVAGHSAHEFDHPEIGFSLLTSSPDRSAGKPVFHGAVFEDTAVALVRPDLKFITADLSESAGSVVLPVCLSTRAPPVTA